MSVEVCGYTAYSQTAANFFNEKIRRCGNNYIVVAALSKIPRLDTLDVFVPKPGGELLRVGNERNEQRNHVQKSVFVKNPHRSKQKRQKQHGRKQNQIGQTKRTENGKSAHTVATKYGVVEVVTVHTSIVPQPPRFIKRKTLR